MDNFVILMGTIALLRGLQYIISPSYIRTAMERWQHLDDTAYRLFGAFVFSVGLFIIYLGVV